MWKLAWTTLQQFHKRLCFVLVILTVTLSSSRSAPIKLSFSLPLVHRRCTKIGATHFLFKTWLAQRLITCSSRPLYSRFLFLVLSLVRSLSTTLTRSRIWPHFSTATGPPGEVSVRISVNRNPALLHCNLFVAALLSFSTPIISLKSSSGSPRQVTTCWTLTSSKFEMDGDLSILQCINIGAAAFSKVPSMVFLLVVLLNRRTGISATNSSTKSMILIWETMTGSIKAKKIQGCRKLSTVDSLLLRLK